MRVHVRRTGWAPAKSDYRICRFGLRALPLGDSLLPWRPVHDAAGPCSYGSVWIAAADVCLIRLLPAKREKSYPATRTERDNRGRSAISRGCQEREERRRPAIQRDEVPRDWSLSRWAVVDGG